MSQTITLTVRDNSTMNAYVAMPQGAGHFPAIMVFQEAFGVNNAVRVVADRLANEGYIAIAPELFHRTSPAGFEAGYADFEQVKEHFMAITIPGLEADVQACYDWMQSQSNIRKDKIGCIGFCLGGRVSFVANSYLPLSAAVSFYGGGTHMVMDRVSNIHGPQLFVWAGKDNHILPEHVQTVTDTMKQADKDFINVNISYAEHAFFNADRAAYHKDASAEAWGITKAFFENKLKN